jgi:hypothetical protein
MRSRIDRSDGPNASVSSRPALFASAGIGTLQERLGRNLAVKMVTFRNPGGSPTKGNVGPPYPPGKIALRDQIGAANVASPVRQPGRRPGLRR